MVFKGLSFSNRYIIFINELLNMQVIKTLKNDVLVIVLQDYQMTNCGRGV